jgi:hypothetical protein
LIIELQLKKEQNLYPCEFRGGAKNFIFLLGQEVFQLALKLDDQVFLPLGKFLTKPDQNEVFRMRNP